MDTSIICTVLGVGAVNVGTLIYFLGGMRARVDSLERDRDEQGRRITSVEANATDTAVRVGKIEGRIYGFPERT